MHRERPSQHTDCLCRSEPPLTAHWGTKQAEGQALGAQRPAELPWGKVGISRVTREWRAEQSPTPSQPQAPGGRGLVCLLLAGPSAPAGF